MSKNTSNTKLFIAESGLLESYLEEMMIRDYHLMKFAKAEMNKLDKKQYEAINLSHFIYGDLLNYCILHLNPNKKVDVKVFESLINQSEKGKLFCSLYNSIDTPFMISKHTPLQTAINLNTDNGNKFAYILVQHGYGANFLVDGTTAVHLAATSGNITFLEMIKYIPEIDFNYVDKHGHLPLTIPLTQLSFANYIGYHLTIQKLIKLGANINFIAPSDYTYPNSVNTISHFLVENGLLESFKIAKSYGMRLDLVDYFGNTLAQHAILYNKPHMLEYLLSQGLGAKDYNKFTGSSTLSLVIERGMHEYVKKIIEMSDNIYYETFKRTSIINSAFNFLTSYTCDTEEQLEKGLNTIELLLARGFEMSEENFTKLEEIRLQGYTYIHNQVTMIYEKILGINIKGNIKINIKDNFDDQDLIISPCTSDDNSENEVSFTGNLVLSYSGSLSENAFDELDEILASEMVAGG